MGLNSLNSSLIEVAAPVGAPGAHPGLAPPLLTGPLMCPLCQEPLAANETLCDVCGTLVPQPEGRPHCAACGGAVTRDDCFCPHCGRPLAPPPAAALSVARPGGASRTAAPVTITLSSGPAAPRPAAPQATDAPAPPPPTPRHRAASSAPVTLRAARPGFSRRWRLVVGGVAGSGLLGLLLMLGLRVAPEEPITPVAAGSGPRLWVSAARVPAALPSAGDRPPGADAAPAPPAAPVAPPAPPPPAAPVASPAAPPAPPTGPEPTPPAAGAGRAPTAAPDPAAQLARARRTRETLRAGWGAPPAPPPAPAASTPPAVSTPPAPLAGEPPRTREILARHLVLAALADHPAAWDSLLAQLRTRQTPVSAAQSQAARRLQQSAQRTLRAQNYAQGAEAMRAAFAQHPGDPAITADLVAALQQLQRFDAADTTLMEALGHQPERWENWVTLGQNAALQGQRAQASAAFRAATRVAATPAAVEARLNQLATARDLDARIQAAARAALATPGNAP